ncbi:MAG: hypothetical protein J0M22_18155 [Gammaproteobacteria bacterium]|nr:hypothetical protein [Gammaproteobacteria bacterium]
MQAVKHLIRQMLTLLLVTLTLTLLVAWLLLDRLPLLTAEPELNANAVKHSQQLINNLHQSIQSSSGQPLVFAANLEELNSAFVLASRTLPGFHGQALIGDTGLSVLLTMPVSGFWGDAYLNTQIVVVPSEGPLTIRQVRIGSLNLPGKMALTIVERVADQVWGAGAGAALLANVRSVTLQPNAVTVEIQRPEGFSLGQLKQSGLSMYKALFSSPEQRADIEFYYQVALNYSQANPDASLVAYLQLLFRQAHTRTAIYPEDPERVVRENQAVILALAQLLGGKNLQMLVNEVKRDEGIKPPKVTLARRADLQQHFIYSASIHLLGSQKISATVGEAKELLDSTGGGSGFSFVDLLADRAGIRFAKIATGDIASAQAVQQFFMAQDRIESEVFPSKARLPEGIPQALFEEKFKSVNSADYQQMVNEIDRRLNALPLYQIAR